ncbi:MAG: phosphoribosyltransferase family protein [Oscillospiraceae bacterium]|nr:phosphoribosyltransferase family protein [Oscillospiraceae bacterium]
MESNNIKYTADKILKFAKRYNNSKRSYLLVNPLQAKHMAVSPSEALNMMQTLGTKLFEKYPDNRLVIGFAETATAVGAVVASCFDENCNYIHTTRENLQSDNFIEFLEEHSHATEQKLSTINLNEFLDNTNSVTFIDDEISTGKTLINIINQLRNQLDAFKNKEIICASIINRVSDENMKKLSDNDIKCEYLLKIENEDCEKKVKDIHITSAEDLMNVCVEHDFCEYSLPSLKDARTGVNIKDYKNKCLEISKTIAEKIGNKISGDILVLGTEEFMYQSIILGKVLEDSGKYNSICCHSTTRSPIGICNENKYPIYEGYKIPSFYDENRETYIYNLKHYDSAIITTDSNNYNIKSVSAIIKVLKYHKCEKIFIFRE